MPKPTLDTKEEELFRVKRCFNCQNAVIDLENTEKIVTNILKDKEISEKLKMRLNTNRPLHHQILHFAIAGCPNSCSQPQIKDFGVQGQVIPKVSDGCIFCEQCINCCPDNAIRLNDTGPSIHSNQCMHCGKCIRLCPTEALKSNKIGYRIMIGGKVGRHPRFANVINSLANEDELSQDLSLAIDFFLERSRPGERYGQLLERVDEQELNKYFKK